MPDKKQNQGRKRQAPKQQGGKSPARKSPPRKAPPKSKGPARKGKPVQGGPSRAAPDRASPAVGPSSRAPTSPPSQYEYNPTAHYSRPVSDHSMVTAGQDFQHIDPRFSQQQQQQQQQQSQQYYQDDPAYSRRSPRLGGRHSPQPEGPRSPAADGRTSPWLDEGRASPRQSSRNSPRLTDRRSARLANGDEEYSHQPQDVRIEMGSINPGFSEQERSPLTSPNREQPGNAHRHHHHQRSGSNASSVSYRSSNGSGNEIIERELIAANLRDPSSVMEMLPSRQLGRTLSSATSSNKWLRKRSQKSLRRGRSLSSGRHAPDNDVGMEMVIERILADEDSAEGTGRKHSLNRKNTIRNIQGSLGTKRKIRAEVRKHSDRRQHKSVGMFKYWRYQIAYGWESFKEWLSNLTYSLELWRAPIKKIEGNFGSGVKSYFVLLKLLLLLNIPVFILSFGFITVPQLLYLPSPAQNNSRPFTGAELLTGQGWLIETELYFGYYTNHTFTLVGNAYYNMPVAYLFASSGYLLLIFVVLSQGMSKTYRKYFITGDRQHNFYTPKVFCGWDYNITSESTAKLKQRSIYLELAEHLASHHGSKKRQWMSTLRWVLLRLATNLVILGIIVGASYLIFFVYKEKAFATDVIIIGDLAIALLVSGYNLVLPYIFSVIGYLEKYENPRTTLYFSLFRTFLMKATILVVLVYHWFSQIECTSESVANTLPCQCWETFLGTEVYKLVVVDFFVQILATFFLEFIRRIGRDYLCTWFASPEFDIARNTMDLIQSQTYTWIGMFFAPLLMIICIVKLILLFYIKQVSVLYNCKPSLHPWRVGIAQTLFFIILFLMYAICVVAVGYSFASIQPSVECGPFRGLDSVYDVVTRLVNQWEETQAVWNFIITFLTTQGVVAAIITLLCLAVYYYRTVTQGRQKTVKRLKQQIALEGKDKLFLLRMLQNAIRNHHSLRQAAGSSADAADGDAASAIPPPMPRAKKQHAKLRGGLHTALSPKVQDAVDSADVIIHRS